MVEAVTAIVGAIFGLITAGTAAYAKILQLKNEHTTKLKELDTAREVALSEAEQRLKSAEDAKQNAAFANLERVVGMLQSQLTTSLERFSRLESQYGTMEEAHERCQEDYAELKKENLQLEEKIKLLESKVTELERRA